VNRFICVHGHFYQPPRENPWLESIETQETAYPFHDWNERIQHECYAPNATARILNEQGRIVKIVDNYSWISFNFGPTLLAWMQWADPETYDAILEADKSSLERFSGHGSAMAQAHGHIIMPLSNTRDKHTQVIWGVRDFQSRFGRDPEGMWLPETAVDTESLEIMAEHGIKFTLLAPRQAAAVRRRGEEQWHDVSHENVDPTRPYEVRLPSGKTIAVFFYDGPVSRAVAFEQLLDRGETFANRILGAFPEEEKRKDPRLVHIATDGETYGHHHRYGEMALAYALHHIDANNLATITNYAEYLETHPPKWEARIHENSSWSCVHGVERWRSDCGCNTGMHGGWNQSWRKPLREALDWLRDQLAPFYEERAGKLLKDPWAARDAYIDLVLDRSPESTARFFEQHAAEDLSEQRRIDALKLLELQRHAMLMYTSCGWFFDDLSGIETTQVLRYAARAIQLGQDLGLSDVEPKFLELLAKGRSNLREQGDGRQIYDRHIRRSVVSLSDVCAHFAVSSLFEDYEDETRIYAYHIERRHEVSEEAGRSRITIGRARVTSEITHEDAEMTYAVLHFGDHNINGGVRVYQSEEEYQSLVRDALDRFSRADFSAVFSVFHQHFGGSLFTLATLFRDEQQKVVNRVLEHRIKEIEGLYQQLYEQNAPIMRFISNTGASQPEAFRLAADFVTNSTLHRLLTADPIETDEVRSVIEEAHQRDVELDKRGLAFTFERSLNRYADAFAEQGGDVEFLEQVEAAVRLAPDLPFDTDLWTLQQAYYRAMSSLKPDVQTKADKGDDAAARWLEVFASLGDALGFQLEESS